MDLRKILCFLFWFADYVAGGELFTHLHQMGPFSEEHARVYAAEITLALEQLHSVTMATAWRAGSLSHLLAVLLYNCNLFTFLSSLCFYLLT